MAAKPPTSRESRGTAEISPASAADKRLLFSGGRRAGGQRAGSGRRGQRPQEGTEAPPHQDGMEVIS